MRIGDLKERILIQRYGDKEESQEVKRYAWHPYKKVWSKMKTIRSKADEYIFEVRLGVDITAHDSIIYEGRFFKVLQTNRGSQPYKLLEVKVIETTPKVCTIFRTVSEKNPETNRLSTSLKEVGEYPCAVFRKTFGISEEKNYLSMKEIFIIHTMYKADIKAGDLIEIDSIKYVAGIPFNPNNYRTEVEITLKGDV